jgi:hypothetical protein
VKEFVELCKKVFEQKKVVDDLKDQVKEENKKLTGLQLDALKMFDALELEKQAIPGFGTIYVKTDRSVKTPKTIAEKRALNAWIAANKGEDVLESMQSIASATLNSFWKKEFEQAVEDGNMNFKMDGIEPPTEYKKIGMRKG